MGTLPVELREVFGLVFYYGWSSEDLAGLLGIHVRTGRRRLTAMKALRKAVGGVFPEALGDGQEGGGNE